MDIYEFKIRFIGDRTKWELINVAFSENLSRDEAKKTARGFSNMQNVVEVRYNARRGSQGYYVGGSPHAQFSHQNS